MLMAKDPTKVRNDAQYISIDGRPVSTERGTMKEIVKSYKRHVKNILPSAGPRIPRPFLYMLIRCPPQSYEVNVEPAKDQILFLDTLSAQLLSLVERLFDRVYPTPDNPEQESGSPKSKKTSSRLDSSVFNRVMLRSTQTSDDEDTTLDVPSEVTVSEVSDVQGVNPTNPFVIAAMNATVKPVRMDVSPISAPRSLEAARKANQGVQTEREHRNDPLMELLDPPLSLPNTVPSSDFGEALPLTPDGSISPMSGLGEGGTDTTLSTRITSSMSRNSRSGTPGHRALSTWLTPESYRPTPSHYQNKSQGSNPAGDVTAPNGTSSRALSGQPAMPFMRGNAQLLSPAQKPFKVPLKFKANDKPLTQFDPPLPPVTTQIAGQSRERQHQRGLVSSEASPDEIDAESNTELEDIMEFEYRKRAAIAHQKKLAARVRPLLAEDDTTITSRQAEVSGALGPASIADDSSEQPSRADYNARFGGGGESDPSHSSATRAADRQAKDRLIFPPPNEDVALPTITTDLADDQTRETPATPVLPPTDPRAYLMRQRRKSSHGKLHRTNSFKLPLESIIPETETFALELTRAFPDLEMLPEHALALSCSEVYVRGGTLSFTNLDSIDSTTTREWEDRVRDLIRAGYGPMPGEQDLIDDMKLTVRKIS
jgi:hypothetical protein